MSSDPVEAARTNQIALTIADFVDEVHNTHHPIASSLAYEVPNPIVLDLTSPKDQKTEAARYNQYFLKERLPKFLKFFESVIAKSQEKKYLIGDKFSYVDLSMFHVLEGLDFAYPKNLKKIAGDIPNLLALQKTIRERPNIAAYMQSDRRKPFSNGIFRHYAELDVE